MSEKVALLSGDQSDVEMELGQPPDYKIMPSKFACQPFQQAYPEPHSVLAWLTFFFCFWPFGLVAIVKSHEVNLAVCRGDMQAAQKSSKSAKLFGYAAIGVGLLQFIACVILLLVYCVYILPSLVQLTQRQMDY